MNIKVLKVRGTGLYLFPLHLTKKGGGDFMTNEELVEQIQQGNNVQQNLSILYEQNKGFIYKVVSPFMKYAEADDLLQEGYLGLHEAVYAYKPGDSKFITYLPYRVRKSCIRHLENSFSTKRIPTHKLTEIRKYNNFCQDYVNENGCFPDDKTIIRKLELTEKQLNSIKKTIYEQNCISIYSVAPGTEDATLEDIIADPFNMEEDVEEKLFKEHKRKVLDEAISTLKEAEQIVIRSRYWEDGTQIQLAKEFKLSNSRIGQLESDALKKLKKIERLQELRDEVYGYDSKKAYMLSKRYCIDKRTSSTEMIAIKRIMLEEQQKSLTKNVDDIFAELLEG